MAKKKPQKKFSTSKENPFNVKINRSKHSILGQKVKGTRGLPGISHSISNARRRDELQKKRLLSQKSNKFLDRRLMDSSLSYEEQTAARFVEERKKKFRKNIFNLNDEEVLTHKGVPLGKHKSLNDVLMDSDDEEQLDPTFVKQAHFGGFVGDTTSVPKSRKEIIDELILESKKRKQERKIAREKQEDLVERLDQQWKEMHKLLPALKEKKQVEHHTESDPFDILLNELKFETKATPADKRKSPEEIAKEEEEKLRKLEEERNKRMMGPVSHKNVADNHLSADSIYDGLDIQFEPIDEPVEANVNTVTSDQSEDDESGDDSSDDNENEANILSNQKIIETASESADNYQEILESMETFCSLVENQQKELYDIIENILKDNIKAKSKKKIEKLENFFGILLEYSVNSNNNFTKLLENLNEIVPHLYNLAEVSPVNTAMKILVFLDNEEELFQLSKGKKMKKNFPRHQTLVLFKIITALYSVSDFQHPVVTPAVIFMCDILSSPFAVSYQNIVTRLYVTNAIYNCVSYSKKYVPEIVWFLNKILLLAVDNSKRINLFVDKLAMAEERIELDLEKAGKEFDSNMKVSILFEVVELLHKFSILYNHLPPYGEIFSPSLNILHKLPTKNYPNFLKDVISKFVSGVKSVNVSYKPLAFENKKPVPLKLFEPMFESKFTKKKDDIKKKKKLIKSVNQKIRKEEKGLLREMRRDNQVLASEKLKEQIAADEERKRKVKQLYSELASQEGEYKKFLKKK